MRPGQAWSRERLASLLWADVPDEQARHSVRQAFFALRQALPPLKPAILVTEGESVALNPEAADVDVVAFERLVARSTREALEQAVALYRGDLLEGFTLREPPFEEWLDQERQRLRALAIDALERLVADSRQGRAAEQAIRTAIRLLALDPVREHAHRALIRLYHATGQAHAAVRQYQACARVLERELGIKPDAETRQLYEQIVAERSVPRAAPAPPGAHTTPRTTILVVEDEPVTRALLEGFLAAAGYEVAAVEDGAAALTRLGGARFDLILADIAMPTLDGLSLLEVMRRDRIDTPVVFLTARPAVDLEVRALALGAADFIRKPIQKEVLLLRVQKALGAVSP